MYRIGGSLFLGGLETPARLGKWLTGNKGSARRRGKKRKLLGTVGGYEFESSQETSVFLSVSRTYDAMSISSLSRVVMFKQVFTLHACDSFCVCSFHRTVFYRYIQVKLRETEK